MNFGCGILFFAAPRIGHDCAAASPMRHSGRACSSRPYPTSSPGGQRTDRAVGQPKADDAAGTLLMVLMIGGIPAAIGAGLTYLGNSLRKKSD